MKILKARTHLPEVKFKVLEIPVHEIRIIPPIEWIDNRSKQFGYNESFENKGMLFPIVVTSWEPQWVIDRILPKNPHHAGDKPGTLKPYMYVHVGNKRVYYAQQNGYDRIEGYFVEKQEDKSLIQRLQHIPHTEIPK